VVEKYVGKLVAQRERASPVVLVRVDRDNGPKLRMAKEKPRNVLVRVSQWDAEYVGPKLLQKALYVGERRGSEIKVIPGFFRVHFYLFSREISLRKRLEGMMRLPRGFYPRQFM
jgi:hypothetical protein